jgi:type VI secretion system secreted protein Hcp
MIKVTFLVAPDSGSAARQEWKMAVDMFQKLDGIKGESHDSKHPGEIDIHSVTWGAQQIGSHGTGGGGGSGKVHIQDIHITKHVDRASADLFYNCCSGKHIPNGYITLRKAGDKPLEYLKIKLTDVLVSAVNYAGSGHDDKAMETLALNFAKFEQEYFEQKKDGTGETAGRVGWDVKKNEKV